MLDKLRELIISKDGVYNIVIPLFTCSLSVIMKILSTIKETSHFNFVYKEKSSFEKYYGFQLRCMILAYVLVYGVYIIILFCLLIIEPNWLTRYIIEHSKYLFSFICIVIYGVLIYDLKKEGKENIVNLKWKTKNHIWKYIIFYGAIIDQGAIIFTGMVIQNNSIVNIIEGVIFYIFMLGSPIVLDIKSYVKYKYVYLMFENGIETDAIPCEDIKKEKDWIIVTSELKGEIHYKVNDIKSFRYSNRAYIKI